MILNLKRFTKKRAPVILQRETYECGHACAAMVLAYHGRSVDLASLRSQFGVSVHGTSLFQIATMLRSHGMGTKAFSVAPSALGAMACPCVIHWRSNHFVVLLGADEHHCVINDPALGKQMLSRCEFEKHYSGVVLVAKPTESFVQCDLRKRFRIKEIAVHISAYRTTLAYLFGISLLIELLGILIPRQIQWAVDSYPARIAIDLIVVVTLAFCGVVALQTVLTIAKNWAFARLGSALNLDWYRKLLTHVLRLPANFFYARHVGDVAVKFQSLRTIQTALTKGVIDGVLSGFFGILAFVAISTYSISLALLVLGVVVAYSLARTFLVRRVVELSRNELMWNSTTHNDLIETVNGVESIYVANMQGQRISGNISTLERAMSFTVQGLRISGAMTPLGTGIFSLSRVLIVGGVVLFLNDQAFTSGMLVACVAYADIFYAKAAMLLERLFELKHLKGHFEGIAEYAMTQPQDLGDSDERVGAVAASISLRDLGFRYSPSDPWVFRGLNAEIASGESVAIVGSSGAGKSTVAKLILGLVEPTEGEVLIGGVPLSQVGIENFRKICATVLQDDCLFSGSIADNICWFAPECDQQKLERAAMLAAIHDDIVRMPMKYLTGISGRTGGLSGGQRQRIILARALYKEPCVLLLDEATSHLDVGNEAVINTSLSALKITRVLFAHRQETIRSADRVIDLVAAQTPSPIANSATVHSDRSVNLPQVASTSREEIEATDSKEPLTAVLSDVPITT